MRASPQDLLKQARRACSVTTVGVPPRVRAQRVYDFCSRAEVALRAFPDYSAGYNFEWCAHEAKLALRRSGRDVVSPRDRVGFACVALSDALSWARASRAELFALMSQRSL